MKVSVTRWTNGPYITHEHAVLINDKLLAVSHTLTNQALAECLRAELLTEEVENHLRRSLMAAVEKELYDRT